MAKKKRSTWTRKQLKQELKRNEVADMITDTGAYIRQHFQLIGTVVVVLLLAVAGYWFYSQYQSRNVEEGLNLINKARTALSKDNYTDAVTQLDKLASDYSSSPDALLADLMRADLNLAKGSFSGAIDIYKRLLTQAEKGPLENRLNFSLAVAYLSNDEAAQALPLLDQLQKAQPPFPLQDSLHYYQALALQATGKNDEAIAGFRTVDPTSPWSSDARSRVEQLLADEALKGSAS